MWTNWSNFTEEGQLNFKLTLHTGTLITKTKLHTLPTN